MSIGSELFSYDVKVFPTEETRQKYQIRLILRIYVYLCITTGFKEQFNVTVLL